MEYYDEDDTIFICERCEEDYVIEADWQDECYCHACYHELFPCQVCEEEFELDEEFKPYFMELTEEDQQRIAELLGRSNK